MRTIVIASILILAAGSAAAYAPDTLASQQWHLANTKWTVACPFGCGDGSVVVAVIDTKYHYPHEDLASRWWINADEIAANGVDDDSNGYIDDRRGWDFIDNDSDSYDLVTLTKPALISGVGHGTLVSGVLGGITGNGKGIAGMAKVQIMALRGSTSSAAQSPTSPLDVGEAIRYAVDNGAHVISMSLFADPTYWSPADMDVLRNAIGYAHAANVVMVAAAGNNGVDVQQPETGCGLDSTRYPASDWRVIGVAGTNPDDKTSILSYWGPEVDIAAPMEDIWSTYARGSDSYDFSAGTSYATPQVAAIAALIVEDHLGANGRLAIPALDVLEILTDSADPIVRDPAHTCLGGSASLLMPFGKLNVQTALSQSSTW